MTVTSRLREAGPPPPGFALYLLGATALLVLADAVAGPLVRFPIFYTLPVLAAAWFGAGIWAGAYALALPLVRVAFDLGAWRSEQSIALVAVNAAIRVFVLALIAALAWAAGAYVRSLRHQVVMLEGILPICSHCRRIRAEDGVWQPLEEYISARMPAQFSRGLCTHCLKKYYGEELQRIESGPSR